MTIVGKKLTLTVPLLLLLISTLFCVPMLFAQPYLDVRPISFDDAASQRRFGVSVDVKGLLPLERVDAHMMPLVSNDSLLNTEEKKTSGPFKFGYPKKVRLGTDNAGTWETLPNGDRIWRLRIISPGAYSLNFIYDAFTLPEGSLFFIYDDLQLPKVQNNLIGAFSSEHSSTTGVYATDLLKGGVAILEYYEPRAVRGKGKISLSYVIHAYKDALGYTQLLGEEPKKNGSEVAGSALGCHLDVNGSAGTNYQTVKKGVAVVLAGLGTELCSGSLINNTGTSYRPYFLTALHCVGKPSGILDAVDTQYLQAWMFKFNYESGGSQSIVYGNGCTLRASNTDGDMLMVELNQKVSTSLFLNGWSNLSSAPTTPVVSIHHPRGDLKKISISNSTPTSTAGRLLGFTYLIQEWQVGWDYANGVNTGGLIEPGSSGGPLFNQQLRIVGQNSGIDLANCGSQQTAFIGKLDASWTSLQSWLNPAGGTVDYDGAPPMNITVNGPGRLTPGNTGTLTANVSGGLLPYQYDWYVTYPPNATEYYLTSGSSSLTIYGNTDEQEFIVRVRDAALPQGKIEEARRTVVNGFGTLLAHSPSEISIETYPNPVSVNSVISYTLPDDAIVQMEVCNTLMQTVAVLAKDVYQKAGYQELRVNKELPNGAYFIRFVAREVSGAVHRQAQSVFVTN
jgi:Trypsin-like peptidase domain